MKYLGILVLSVLLMGFIVVGSAFAISDITRAGEPSTKIAKEVIDPSAGYVHNGAQKILFKIDKGLSSGNRIAISLTGATFENIDELLFCDNSTSAAGNATLNWFSTDERRADFVANGTIDRGYYYIAEEDCSSPKLVLRIDPGVSAVAVTIATDNATETPSSATNSQLYLAQQQFAMSARGESVTETIDVEKDLLKFVPTDSGGVRDTETVAYYDNGATGFKATDTSPDLKAIIIANVNVNFEVTGKMAGISSMKLIDTNGSEGTSDDADIATFTIDTANNKATASMKLSDLLNKNVAIKLTVDGSTPLEDRAFSINAKLTPADDVKVGTTLIDATATADVAVATGAYIAKGKNVWEFSINGLQFVAPYVRQDSVVGSVIRVENAANRDSKVWVFVNNGGVWSLVNSYSLLKGDKLVLSGQKIMDDAQAKGIALDGTKGFGVWGVVKGTPNDNKNITVYGSQQMIGGSFRPLPIQVHSADWYE